MKCTAKPVKNRSYMFFWTSHPPTYQKHKPWDSVTLTDGIKTCGLRDLLVSTELAKSIFFARLCLFHFITILLSIINYSLRVFAFTTFQTKSNQKKQGAEKRPAGKEAKDPSQLPQSINEFERLVLSSPNISANWIQYMDFHLQATELEQARAVAERALQTIYFR